MQIIVTEANTTAAASRLKVKHHCYSFTVKEVVIIDPELNLKVGYKIMFQNFPTVTKHNDFA